MSGKQLISPKELEQFFESKGNIFVNPHELEIDFTEEVDCRIQIWNKSPLSLDLNTELEIQAFISEFGVSSSSDLDVIEENNLWQLYKKGNGHVWASLFDEGPELSFRVIGGNTIIEGFQLPYRDEINEIWDNAGAFREYIRDNIRGIYVAAEAE